MVLPEHYMVYRILSEVCCMQGKHSTFRTICSALTCQFKEKFQWQVSGGPEDRGSWPGRAESME